MLVSPLAEHFRRQGGELAEYRGSLTRADGGEAAALPPDWPRHQVVLSDASWRAVLAISGSEARKWLNGMISANVRDLAIGRWVPSFQLDPKGHILATLDVACVGADSFLLLTDEAQRVGLEQRLRRFIFISKLCLEDSSERWSGLRLRGPEWPQAWRHAGLAELALAAGEEKPVRLGDGSEGIGLGSAPGGIAQLELLAPTAAIAEMWTRLEKAAQPVGAAVVERDRILSREPRYGADITAGELPQETGQADRLDFTKGCYIGQEIVERVRARGAVHRHWSALALAAEAPPGAAIEAEGRAVGQLTSIARRGADWLGLGYVRDPHQAPGTVLAVEGVAARVEA